MFREWSFCDRIGAAADAGFTAVECQWPYEVSASKLSQALYRYDIPMVLINAPVGSDAVGAFGIASIPGRETECREGIALALQYSKELRCDQVHLLSGCAPSHHGTEACRSALIENARYAADIFKPQGTKVLLEPINTCDVPGYFLNRTSGAISVIEAVNRENIGLQLDIYHSHRMDDDPRSALMNHGSTIAHVQISGFPGRHEPDEGEIDYPPLFELIDASEFRGWIGCEYVPKTGTVEGLKWAAEYGVLSVGGAPAQTGDTGA